MSTTSPAVQDSNTDQPQPAPSSSFPAAPTQIRHQAYSGPIPPPAILEQYNVIIPDAAERIIRMAEKNAAHRQAMESAVLNANIEAGKRKHKEITKGQLFGIISVLASFSVAAIALALGNPATAATISGTTVVGLVTAFVTGQKPRILKNKAEKNETDN